MLGLDIFPLLSIDTRYYGKAKKMFPQKNVNVITHVCEESETKSLILNRQLEKQSQGYILLKQLVLYRPLQLVSWLVADAETS